MAREPFRNGDASKPSPDAIIPSPETATAPAKPLLGCGRDLLTIDPKLDLTEPADADWEALA